MMKKHGGKREGSGRKPLCPEGRKIVTFRICIKLHEKLKAWCAAYGREPSSVVNEAVAKFLKDENTLYIIRGLPGSGKTTLARRLARTVCEADDYFVGADGGYRYDSRYIEQAHASCFSRCEEAMKKGGAIAVSNTFTRKTEYEAYLKLADRYGYVVQIIVCGAEFENIHHVPRDVIEKMRKRFEY